MESILDTVKKILGLAPEYTHFDTDIILHINSVIIGLTQMGIGPEEGFSITGSSETWNDFLGGRQDMEAVKSYMALKVRLAFDPPANGTIIEAMKGFIEEFEWRSMLNAENTKKDDDDE